MIRSIHVVFFLFFLYFLPIPLRSTIFLPFLYFCVYLAANFSYSCFVFISFPSLLQYLFLFIIPFFLHPLFISSCLPSPSFNFFLFSFPPLSFISHLSFSVFSLLSFFLFSFILHFHYFSFLLYLLFSFIFFFPFFFPSLIFQFFSIFSFLSLFLFYF